MMRYRDRIQTTARADLRGFAKVGAVLLPFAAAAALLLRMLGWNLASERVRFSLWIPTAIAIAFLIAGALWRAFWRLTLTHDALTWHLLTRRYTLPLDAITEVGEEVSFTRDKPESFITVRAKGHDSIYLDHRSWKGDQLRAVLRALQQRKPGVSFDESVLSFIDDSDA